MRKLATGSKSPEAWAVEIRDWFASWSDNHSALLEPIIPVLLDDFADHFHRTQAPYGTWPPRVDNLPHPLLNLTGKMKQAATTRGAPGNISLVEPFQLTVGVDGSIVNYASFQNDGTSRIPARPFIWLSERAEDEAFDAYVEAAAAALL